MAKKRAYVLTVAGFDPSGGAGVLADVKTFENHQVVGLAAVTALTYQHESLYIGTRWVDMEEIKRQLDPLFDTYKIDWAKIGLVQDLEALHQIVDYLLLKNPQINIILDPILKASGSEKAFHETFDVQSFEALMRKLFLITPNWEEMSTLSKGADPLVAAGKFAAHCHVFLKGGHRADKPGYDTLMVKMAKKWFSYRPKRQIKYPKHGSGCVVSAAILANLANGYPLHKSCLKAKRYIEDFLNSNPSLLGWHKS